MTCPRDRSRIVTLTVVLPRYNYYSSQNLSFLHIPSIILDLNVCSDAKDPDSHDVRNHWNPQPAALQLCCRPTLGHQLVRMLQRCGDCGAVATSYSVTAAEKLGRQKSVATTISSAWASPPSLCIGTLTPTLGKKMLAYHLHPPHI